MPSHVLPSLLKIGDYVLDKDRFTLSHTNQRKNSSGRKRRIEFECISCSSVYITKLRDEVRKERPWLCRSCRVTEEWKTPGYRNALRSGFTKKTSENLSSSGKKAWKRDYVRRCKIAKEIAQRRTASSFAKGWQTLQKRLKEDENFRKSYYNATRHLEYKTLNGGTEFFRSKLECRFATLLDRWKIRWLYESQIFIFDDIRKFYTPDFWLPELNLWIEIKGRWRGNAYMKWLRFKQITDGSRKIILMTEDIKKMERTNEISF